MVDIPHCVAVFGSVYPYEKDVLDVRIHLGCTKEVSSFELTLQNWDGRYSPGGALPITVGLEGSIAVGRGFLVPALIACRVENLEFSTNPQEHYLKVTGRCLGERFFRNVMTVEYVNFKAEDIVKDLMDYYTGLSHTRSGTELVEDTSTTYAKLSYEDAPLWDTLKYIAETADLDGAIGYDFRVAPDGKFEFFPVNTKAWSGGSLDETLEVAGYKKDISRVRNRITVKGCAKATRPRDSDMCESITGWSHQIGDCILGGPDDQPVGSHFIIGGNSVDEALFKRVFTRIPVGLTSLVFWVAYSGLVTDKPTIHKVRILAPDESNYFEADIPDLAVWPGWEQKTLVIGPRQTYDVENNPSGIWHEVGIPSWFAVEGVQFHVTWGNYQSIFIDGMHFTGDRWSATEEDVSGSQAAYGLRELVETDEDYKTDAECDLRAKSLLAYYKDPAESITASTTVLDYGMAPILAGDVVQIVLPNEGINGYYRVDSAEYRVSPNDATLEVSFELGKLPPMLADYLYGIRTKSITMEKLARTKAGTP